MEDRFKFRMPMFSDKGNFCEFQYLELGDWIECSLAGSNGEPEQCVGYKDNKGTLVYHNDIVKSYNDEICLIDWDDEFGCLFINSKDNSHPMSNLDFKFEIIGNIHQNKDLLNA